MWLEEQTTVAQLGIILRSRRSGKIQGTETDQGQDGAWRDDLDIFVTLAPCRGIHRPVEDNGEGLCSTNNI